MKTLKHFLTHQHFIKESPDNGDDSLGDIANRLNDEVQDLTDSLENVKNMSQAEAFQTLGLMINKSRLYVAAMNSISMGGQLRPEMAVAHFKTIAEATDLPLIIFQYPLGGGLGHTFETLLRLCEEVPTITAIKDWCNDPMLHEKHIRVFQSLSRPVNILTTHSAWLMSSLVMGCKGLLSGAGSVIADLQVELWRAVQAKDLVRARAVNDRIYPMIQAFYAPPFLDMHNRMKETAVILGRISKAVVRPPLCKLEDTEIARLEAAVKEADIKVDGSVSRAA